MKKEIDGWLVHNARGNVVHVSHRKDDLVVFPGEKLAKCKIIYKTNDKPTTNTKRITKKRK